MDEKKKFSLCAVWNQMDKPPVRKQPHSSISRPPRSSGLQKNDEKVLKHDVVRQSTNQYTSQVTLQKCNMSNESHVLRESSTGTSVRPSSSTPNSRDRLNIETTTVHRNFASRKSSNVTRVRSSRYHKSRENLYVENANVGNSNRAVEESSQATCSRSSVHSKSRNNLHVERMRRSHAQEGRNINNQNYGVQEHEEKNFPNHGRKTWPMSFTTLKELVTKEPNEILLTICPKNSSFMLLIAQDEIRIDMMALILILLGKACSANLKQTLSSFLNVVRGNTNFLVVSIQKFLVSLRQNTIKDYHVESLSYIPVFLQKFQNTLPSSSSDLIAMLLPLLFTKCEMFLNGQNSYNDVMSKLKEIDEQNEYFINQHSHSDIKKASNREALQLLEPPENFRSLPVLPNVDDIYSRAFLRPNIVEGKYIDTEHYLDVQYRLLREDYVRPLRDGIGEYLRLKEAGKPVKNCRDVRVYENVHIVKQDFVNGSMLHIAQLTGEKFSKIKWEYSKRFLSGSLLCLSSDDFKTMLFASVACRLPEKLKEGLLLIRFEEISDDVLNISPSRNFVIIETSAYFEAYRYNLKALHELNEDVLPLKRYIIDVETTLEHPHYMNRFTTYDMRPLLIPMDSTSIKRIEKTNGDISYQYEFPDNISGFRKSVQILDDFCWPTASDLNLDDSQYLALKAAVTKEFAVIQGPPGTGKTYIGLRIVQLLLHNIDKWLINEVNSLPILVVCFTNHALDQFLEGMTCFTNKIVRIGGRGSNEAVAKFQLNNLKKFASRKKEFPKYISTSVWQQNRELKNTKDEIDRANRLIDKCLVSVLGERELKKYIPDIHYLSLKSVVHSQEFNLVDDDFIIHDWLGIRSRLEWSDFEITCESKPEVQHQVIIPENMLEYEVDDLDAEDIGEADIEFIEAQRDIDTEDFADVSFDIEVPEKEEFLPVDDSGWQVQGGRKQIKKYIKNYLNNSKPLEEAEALKIINIWNLNLPQRWDLYKFWLLKMMCEKQEECMDLQARLKRQYEQLCEMRTEEDIYILQNAYVVGMTTTGAAKYRNIVQRLNPQILIVEEAAEILESHIVTSLASGTQHVILIGDHQQLRPSPTVHMLAVKFGLNISLFERMIKNKLDCIRLSVQHRMRPDISDLLVPHIYKDLKNHESVSKYGNITGVSKNVFFITHNFNELQESDSKSKSNEHEAVFLTKLCKYFIQQGYDSSQITVLTTYSGQLFMMKKIVKRNKMIENVRLTVVDNYQGEENDIILISFVRSNDEGEIGFLSVANRVCVALSRARKGLFCIGNFELLAEKSDLWKNITRIVHEKKAIGPSLQLVCQNHPGTYSIVANEKDFESVPEGGCTKLCEYRLPCGHVCSLMCHPYDRQHLNVRCHKKCNNTCQEGHECQKKCFEDCGPCMYVVSKKVYPCEHTIKVPCHKQHSEVNCDADCRKILSCGHKCPNQCSDPCVSLCRKMITVKSTICGHEVQIACFNKNHSEELLKNCKNPCNVILDCGHKCSGKCSSCHQGRLHVACNLPCKRILVCGHECKSACAKSCPPCKLPCENKCIHSKCPKECGEPCDVCNEKCEWHCEHKKCSRLCGEMCNRVPCNEPCRKLLKCGHPCIGFCGEPCPEECRICDNEVVKEIFFGTEDDDDARFVRLEDCNHILEISGLNEWISVENSGNHQIQMKVCPKCKTAVRTNLRFGNTVKDCLKKIENVKQKTFGNVKNNKHMQEMLLIYVETNTALLLELKSSASSLYDICKKILTSKKCRSIQEITTMENVIRISLELANARFDFMTYRMKNVDQDPLVKEGISVLSTFIENSEIWLFGFMCDEIFTASEQQLQQLSWEIHRFKLGYILLKFTKERTIRPNSHFEKCVKLLTNYFSFSENDMKVFCNSFEALTKSCGSAVVNISEMEKQSILKAMNLSIGHWYQCPNGHVYCITECGGAMEEGRCNECNSTIGGRNHSLLSTNRVATDMDGARHGAWSAEMNLQNYALEFYD